MDYISDQRKEHRGYEKHEARKKVLELKPDALGGLSATAAPDEALNFQDRSTLVRRWMLNPRRLRKRWYQLVNLS